MEHFIAQHNSIYAKNIGILKEYTTENYKLILMKALRLKGFENSGDTDKGKKGTAGNTAKLQESISRTKSTIYELASCNEWELFVTLTLSGDYRDRKDLKSFKKDLSKYINNYNYQHKTNIKYLLIPEPHKDGAWHMHGLFMGIPQEHLRSFKTTDNIPQRLKDMIAKGRKLYNWLPYSERFGWVTAEEILDKTKCSKYITKYITKELMETRISLNDHVFYCSNGLARAKVIFKADIRQMFEPDFQNDYVKIKNFNNIEEPLKYFCDKED